ncbi:MAG: hypothetical protein ABJA79_09795 [Parafilimonas sp.]
MKFQILTRNSLLVVILFLVSCTSNEIGNSKDVNPDAVFFDYKVWGEEGKDDITVMLQYRYGGKNGTTLVLNDPASVSLDGKIIPADSSKLTGAFYEFMRPVKDFGENHTIVFTDLNSKKYEEHFNFIPFTLKAAIPAEIKRGDLVFEMEGLNPVDYVRILVTDTSFESPGINRVDTVKNGRIIISISELENLVNGPINLEFYKEDERPVKNGTKEGGIISITYALKKEFELKD